MAEHLTGVRTALNEKLTLPIIKQLLNDLMDRKALNDGEREHILNANGRSDKARVLIDAVINKGDKASWCFITSLKKRDLFLFEELGLPAEPPHAGDRKREILSSAVPSQDFSKPLKTATLGADSWSTNLIPCDESFWNSKKNDLKIYPVTKESVRSRVALLITNIQFENIAKRWGADVDERNMQRLLEDLGYEVVKHTNLTGWEMDKAVLNFSKHPKLKDTDSVFVVIMSHGKSGSILGVNWKQTPNPNEEYEFAIDKIFNHLNSENCRALINKPKIIIIQACRGKKPGNVDLSSGGGPLSPDGAGGSQIVHLEKDFGALLSSTPDTQSYRDDVKGSLLIQFFVEVVKTWACEKDYDELTRMIMGRFEDLTQYDEKQMPTKDRWTLTKPFYLFPGI